MGYRVNVLDEDQRVSGWSLVLSYGLIVIGGSMVVMGLVALAFHRPVVAYVMLAVCVAATVAGIVLPLRYADRAPQSLDQ